MAGNITIQLQGPAGSGLDYAAHLIAESLQAAGASVDNGKATPRVELAATVLRGAHVRICFGADAESAVSSFAARSQLAFAARIAGTAVLALMVAGAEIRLHFVPSLDLFLLLGGVWWFWRLTGRHSRSVRT
jgi:hypothetical protein